jgi:hypothetical protein
MLSNSIKQELFNQQHFTYLNVAFSNPVNSQDIENADFETDTTLPILPNAEEYLASIVSFEVPNNFPLFIFKENTYRITLSHLTSNYTVLLNPVPYTNHYLLSTHIYYVQQFLDSINNGFLAAYNLLIADYPGIVLGAPVMVYNNGKLTLNCNGLNYNVDAVNPVFIYFNEPLARYFKPLQQFIYGINLPNYKDSLLLVRNNGAGSSTGSLSGSIYSISTEYDAISSWSEIKSIFVSSSVMGVKNHILLTNTNFNNNNVYAAVIASKDIVVSETKREININYEPKFLTYNDINVKGQLRKVGIRFTYIFKDLTARPLYLFPGESCSIVIQFKHKTILT